MNDLARARLRVVLMRSLAPGEVEEQYLEVLPESTLADVLLSLGWPHREDELRAAQLSVAIWGRRAGLGSALREGDRIELLRPLAVDPKVARRERFKGQGSRGAGLFSRRRAGAKAGY